MTLAHWAAALEQHWGIEAELSRLDGEYDLNFLAKGRDGKGYILKAMRPGCETWLVDMQVKAFEHIAARQPDLPCPRVIASANGQSLLKLPDEDGQNR
ncbi:hypothetical protein, partial [Leisingera sp.]|uniref:hypothetical protein n=1 Tax=Leisingera sp. TaxID=1879318 RepID=UPI002B26FDDC